MGKKFPQRLRELRKEKNISQSSLGKIVGVSKSTISLYEAGKRQSDYDILVKLADFFNVSTDYLLGRTEDRRLKQNTPPNQEYSEKKIAGKRPSCGNDPDDLDDEILDSQLAASMKSDYGKEPSDEYKDMAKRIYKKVLAEVTKEAEDAERKKKSDG